MVLNPAAGARVDSPASQLLFLLPAVLMGLLVPFFGVKVLSVVLGIASVLVLSTLKLNWAFVAIFVVLPVLPHAPTVIGPSELAFAICIILLVSSSMITTLNKSVLNHSLINVNVIVFMLILLATLPLALNSDVPFGEWFRGFAPLSAIALYVPFAQYMAKPKRVLYLLAVVCCIWDIRVLIAYFTNADGVGFRSTYALVSGHLPLSAFGAVIGIAMRNSLGWVLTGLSVAAALSTASRGLIISLAIAGIIMLFRAGTIRSYRGLIALTIVGVITFIPLHQQILPTISSRFAAGIEKDLNHRRIEVKQATEALDANLLLGRGLGWGFDARQISPTLSGQVIPYVHNSIAYFAMATGLLGMVAYHSLVGAAVWMWFRKRLADSLDLAAGGLLIVIGLYGMFQAMFRLFHTNLFLAVALAALLSSRHTNEFGEEDVATEGGSQLQLAPIVDQVNDVPITVGSHLDRRRDRES
jgi:hypothetical protein